MKLGISCSEMILRLDDYVDRALSRTDLEMVEEHLLECLGCARKFSFETSLMDALRERLHHIDVPDGLLARIHVRLKSDQTG